MFRGKDRAPDAPKPGASRRDAPKQGGIARIVAAAKPGRVGQTPPQPKPVAPSRTAAVVPAASAVLTKGKRAYETRRAEKAGMGLEKWMAEKERRVQAERAAIQRAKRKMEPGRPADAGKPGLLRRLLDRAHRPL